MMRGLPRYDSAIAFRISCELPLGGVDRESLHEPLDEIVVETLRCSAPAELEAAARRVVTAAWEEHLHSWTRGILTQLREEYERRLHYLGEAIADLEARRDHSEIAVHVVRRLGERLAVDFELQNDFLQEFEDELASGVGARAVVLELASHARCVLDIPAAEVVAAMHRGLGLSRRGRRPGTDEKRMRRAAAALATDERRARVRAWAADFVEDLSGEVPLLVVAVAEAAERSETVEPEDDELWLGAARGALLQHDAWRVDGAHLDHLHAVLPPV